MTTKSLFSLQNIYLEASKVHIRQNNASQSMARSEPGLAYHLVWFDHIFYSYLSRCFAKNM